MAKTGIAVFGAGLIGKTHITRILNSKDSYLAGISDPSPGAEAMAKELNVPYTANYKDFLANHHPAGVIVATPNATHVEIGIACLERKIPALVEKPIADTLDEAKRLCDAEKEFKTPILIGHHRRHNAILKTAKEIIQSGKLGNMITANVMSTFLKPDNYFEMAWRREKGGGPILINLIHEIDLLRFLFGQIKKIQAVSSNQQRGFEVEDTASVLLTFESGMIGSITLSDTVTSPYSWDMSSGESDHYPKQNINSHFFMGTHGTVTLPQLDLWSYSGPRSWFEEITQTRSAIHKMDPYEAQLNHFIRVIQGTEETICSAEEGYKTLEATLAAKNAANKNTIITL
jgi:predicted dehydrogenase